MSFPKLDDTECLIRKPINQMKWTEIQELVGSQTFAPDARVNFEALLLQASQSRHSGAAYGKVGVVKKNLVFRIKAGNSHIGDDDVLLVRNFVAPEVVKDKHRRLNKKASKPVVTLEWWTTAQGDDAAPTVTVALRKVERARGELNVRESLSAYTDLLIGLTELDQAVGRALPTFGHADDHKTMLLLQEAVAREVDAAERALGAYERRVETARRDTESLILDNSSRRARQAVELLEALITRGEAEEASTQYTTAFTYVNDRGYARGARATLQDQVQLQRISPDDLDVTIYNDLLRQIAQELSDLKRRVLQARTDLDELEQRTPVPGLVDMVGIDMVKARTALQGYRDTLDEVQGARVQLARLVDAAWNLVEVVGDPEQDFDRASQILMDGTRQRQRTETAVGLVRNSGSRFVAMKIEAGIPGGHALNDSFGKLSKRIIAVNMHTRGQMEEIEEATLQIAARLGDELGSALRNTIGG